MSGLDLMHTRSSIVSARLFLTVLVCMPHHIHIAKMLVHQQKIACLSTTKHIIESKQRSECTEHNLGVSTPPEPTWIGVIDIQRLCIYASNIQDTTPWLLGLVAQRISMLWSARRWTQVMCDHLENSSHLRLHSASLCNANIKPGNHNRSPAPCSLAQQTHNERALKTTTRVN